MKHNYMKAFAVVAFAALSATVSAQVKTGAFVEVGPSINVGSSGGPSVDDASDGVSKKSTAMIDVPEVKEASKVCLEVLAGYLWGLADNAAIGFAAGLTENCKFNDRPSLPLLARLKFAFGGSTQVVPFAMMDMGVDLSLRRDFDNTTIRVNPTVGVDIDNFYFGVGYMANIATSGGTVAHNINFKLGYTLTANSKAMRFFKKTYVRLDAGYGKGLSTNDGDDITYGNNISMLATWM